MLYRGEFSGPQFRRIDQKLILAVYSFPDINARLLLLGKPLAKEIAVADFLDGLVSFDGERFANAFAHADSSCNTVAIGPREPCLPFKRVLQRRRDAILH